MPAWLHLDNLRFVLNRWREKLWLKPLLVCLLSVAVAFFAKVADNTALAHIVPPISAESLDALLSVMAASMLVIATFAVASMVSAYASASTSATPRAFLLVLADDQSQNALSTFIGAFIFSIVALTALKNNYFADAGLFSLLLITGLVFAWVIFKFVRWVDSIARLGRMSTIIEKVEHATERALQRRRQSPHLRAMPINPLAPCTLPIYASQIGYVQHVDISALNALANEHDCDIQLAALPGSFVAPGRAIAFVREDKIEHAKIARALSIGRNRLYDDDPRFGLVVLSEIAGRALSPAVNDPGTAIEILGSLVRLFAAWAQPLAEDEVTPEPACKRVFVPQLEAQDLFDDAFTTIARDGASSIEVGLRLQKALQALSTLAPPDVRQAALVHSRHALARARPELSLPDDLERLNQAAKFSDLDGALVMLDSTPSQHEASTGRSGMSVID